MESKEFIKRDDEDHKKFEPIRMKAAIARGVRHEDVRPDYAIKNQQYITRQQNQQDKFVKVQRKDWEGGIPKLPRKGVGRTHERAQTDLNSVDRG